MLRGQQAEDGNDTDVAARCYDAVVFDLDGTLLDTLDDLTGAVNHTMRSFGFPEHTKDEVRGFVGNGIRKLIERSIPGGVDDPSFEKAFLAFQAYYTVHCQEKTHAYPGILQLLSRLSCDGFKLAIVSNKNDAAVKKLRDLYFSTTVDVAMGVTEGRRTKPAPDSVFAALDELGVDVSHAVYVGDSDVDFHTARNAGMDHVLAAWGFKGRRKLEELGTDRIIDAPADLLRFVER